MLREEYSRSLTRIVEVLMRRTTFSEFHFTAQYRKWSRAAEELWPRLWNFVDQTLDIREMRDLDKFGGYRLPMSPCDIAELAYWQRQWMLGMGAAQICANAAPIARSCRAFLLAAEYYPGLFSPEQHSLYETLLDHTCAIETILLDGAEAGQSHTAECLAEAISRCCR